MFRLFCALALLASVCQAAKIPALPLPPYIGEGCKENDPNLNECVIKKGAPAIKVFAKGDPKYRIPNLEPLIIDELALSRGTKQVGFSLTCFKCALRGLSSAQFLKANVDLKGEKIRWEFFFDQVEITGAYNISGKVLLLPITGSGNANFTLQDINGILDYEFDKEKRSNGLHYLKIKNPQLNITTKKLLIQLDNLFNGDKLLGSSMNQVLNENSMEIYKEIAPTISESLAEVFRAYISNVADLVPYETMFPK